jgi:hypothetical protein
MYTFTYLGIAFMKACRDPKQVKVFHSKGCFGNE